MFSFIWQWLYFTFIPFFFSLRLGLTMLHWLDSDCRAQMISLLSRWNYKCAPPCPTTIISKNIFTGYYKTCNWQFFSFTSWKLLCYILQAYYDFQWENYSYSNWCFYVSNVLFPWECFQILVFKFQKFSYDIFWCIFIL